MRRDRMPCTRSSAHGMTPSYYSSDHSRDRPQPARIHVLSPPRCAPLAAASLSASEYTMVLHSNYCPAIERSSPDAIARTVT